MLQSAFKEVIIGHITALRVMRMYEHVQGLVAPSANESSGAVSGDAEMGNVSEEAPSEDDTSGKGGDEAMLEVEQQPGEDPAERAERMILEDDILVQAARLEKARSTKVRSRHESQTLRTSDLFFVPTK